MNHESNCNCAICEEYGGWNPHGWFSNSEEEEFLMMELPDPFDEVLGG